MIIFLYGADSYRSKGKLNEIVAHYKNSGKSGLNFVSLDGARADFEEFYNLFRASSMFAEKKLVILKDVFANKSFQENFVESIKTLESLSDVIVVYESGKPDQRLKIFKTLLKTCKCQEFDILEGKKLIDWIGKEALGFGSKINVDAATLLASSVGNDTWQLVNELQKLALYKVGGIIRREDVMLMVRPKTEADIFKTIDALAQKNKSLALELLAKHLDLGETPLYLLSMIAYQFRSLLSVKELAQQGLMYNSIVKRSGLHPFVVKKNYFLCSQFSFDELKHIYRKIFEIDSDIKVGKIEPETALQLLVSQI